VLREGQMLARVKHPNVVTVFRAQQVGQEVGITMELSKAAICPTSSVTPAR
jgi:hypothetical protein